MTEPDDRNAERRSRTSLAAVCAGIGLVLVVGLVIHFSMIPGRLDTAPGGANPAKDEDTTNGRGAPAQQSAESSVGKNDPAGQEDSTGGRARALKGSSTASSLSEDQRTKVKRVISAQQEPPRVDRADFEMMIGSAVPRQVSIQDVPPEITTALNGYWGDQYVLVRDSLVIVDQHSRRIVAIIPLPA